MSSTLLQIAAMEIKYRMSKKQADLVTRIKEAMSLARDPALRNEIFFMQGKLDEDFSLRAALAAVCMDSPDDSPRVLKSVEMNTVVVKAFVVGDLSELPVYNQKELEECISLTSMWIDAGEEHAQEEQQENK